MSKSRDSNATWDRELKIIFCDLCLREINLGNRPTTHFNKEGWNNLIVSFKGKTGREYNKTQLKNKWDQIKKEWKLWKDLKRGATGLGWDPIRKTIDASDDWWKEKLEVLPTARKFRYSGIDPELEDKLDRMYSGVVAMGEYAWAPSREGPHNLDDIAPDHSHASSFEHLDVDDTAATDACNSQPLPKTQSTRKRKKGGSAFVKEGISSLLASYSTLASSSKNMQGNTTVADTVKVLETMPEIYDDMATFLKATTILEDRTKRDFFLSLAPDRRLPYLRFQIFGTHIA